MNYGIDIWDVGNSFCLHSIPAFPVTVSLALNSCFPYLQVSSNEKNLLVLADYS